MNCYLSSSCFRNTSIEQAIQLSKLFSDGFIEFSAPHKFIKFETLENILKKYYKNTNIIYHNYFPPQKRDFILNLATSKTDQRQLCQKLIKDNLKLIKYCKYKIYGIHPGYLSNEIEEKNRKFVFGDDLLNYNVAENNSIKFVSEIMKHFEKFNAVLLIENLFPNIKRNYSLCCSLSQIEDFFSRLSENVMLLLDLGHWNITSNIMGFDKFKYLEKLINKFENKILEIHLSENDGIEDQHLAIREDSWQISFIREFQKNAKKHNIDKIYCIESRNATKEDLKNSIYYVNEALNI